MVEESSGAPSSARKAKPPGLSINLPDDEETPDKKAAAQASSTAEGGGSNTASGTSGRTSARGAAEASGRTSARGEKSGRTSARGGLSSRGGAPKTVICHEAVLKGNITFGEGCIVHPGAQILAEGGDILIGDFNIIEEYARIVNQPRKDQQGNIVKKPMRIGNYNLFEVGCVIESSEVGDMNEFGVKSAVLGGSQITTGCYINPLVQVPGKSKVAPHSVYIDAGVIAFDQQLREESKRSHMREISAILADSIPQHLKTQVKDANGNWQPVEPQPKTSATNRSTRPGSKQTGGVSARGTGQTSARGTGATSSRAAGATSSRAKAPSAAAQPKPESAAQPDQ